MYTHKTLSHHLRPVNSGGKFHRHVAPAASAVGNTPLPHYAPDAASFKRLQGMRGRAPPSSRPPDLPQKKGLPPGLGRRGRHQAPTKDAMKRRHPAENRLSAQDSLPCWNRRPSFFTISFVKRGGNCGLVSNESITKQGEVADRTKGATWTSNGEPG